MACKYTGIVINSNNQLTLQAIGDGVSSSGTFILPSEIIAPLFISGVGFPQATSYPSNGFGGITSMNMDFSTGVLTFTGNSAQAAGQAVNWSIPFAWIGQ